MDSKFWRVLILATCHETSLDDAREKMTDRDTITDEMFEKFLNKTVKGWTEQDLSELRRIVQDIA